MEAVATTIIGLILGGILSLPFVLGYQHPRVSRRAVEAYWSVAYYGGLTGCAFLIGYAAGRWDAERLVREEGTRAAIEALDQTPTWFPWLMGGIIFALAYIAALTIYHWLVIWPLTEQERQRDLHKGGG